MDITVSSKYVHMSPKKLRIMAQLIKKQPASTAVEKLMFSGKQIGKPLIDIVKTGIADATHNYKQNIDNLYIKTIDIAEGPVFKRFRAVSRGQAHAYVRQTSHITLVLSEKPVLVKKQGTVKKEKEATKELKKEVSK